MEFIDLKAQYAQIENEVNVNIQTVLKHEEYIISSPEVSQLESELCDYTGAKYCVSCTNSTDALHVALMSRSFRLMRRQRLSEVPWSTQDITETSDVVERGS